MATCFLFIHKLTETTCLSLRLDDQGQVDAPLEQRTFDAIKALQIAAQTIVVLACERSSLHRVELPWLSSQKARAALPYALEEQLAQRVATVHIAFDQQHYTNQHYLVAVLDKAYLVALMERLDDVGLDFDVITLDWFALRADEFCISETSMLIHDHEFQGALSAELAARYLIKRISQAPIFVFSESASLLKNPFFKHMDGSFYEWVAKRLIKTHPMNVCQGELQHSTSQQACTRWYQASAILAGISLGIFLLVQGIQSHQLTMINKDLDQKISVIYHEFFPQSTQVISPKFRVEQLLKSQGGSSDKTLWILLDKLADGIKEDSFAIDQFNYQNQILSVTFTSKDFAALEALQLRLKKAGVVVKQAQASLHDQHVLATLELRL